MFRNLQAVWASAAMAAPQKGGFRLVSDYRVVNKQIEKAPGVMPNQEAEIANFRGSTCFGKLDMLQGYWQMPLAAEAQEVFTTASPYACAPRHFERDGLLPRCDNRIVSRLELQGLG